MIQNLLEISYNNDIFIIYETSNAYNSTSVSSDTNTKRSNRRIATSHAIRKTIWTILYRIPTISDVNIKTQIRKMEWHWQYILQNPFLKWKTLSWRYQCNMKNRNNNITMKKIQSNDRIFEHNDVTGGIRIEKYIIHITYDDDL